MDTKTLLLRYCETKSNDDLDALIVANMGLVGQMAVAYGGLGLTHEELVSEGREGLMRAAKAYRPDAGEGSIRAWFDFANKYIQGRMRNALEKLQNFRDRNKSTTDIKAAIGEIDFKTLPADRGLENSELWQEVGRVATDQERQAITLVFKEGQSYRDAADLMQTSKSGVARLIESGLRRIEQSGALESWRQ